jgi:DNA-3-methyladenine glycosylase I
MYQAYAGFDAEKLAHFSDQQLAELQQNPAIIRHRLKINAARNNARAWLALAQESGDVVAFMWQFVGGKPLQNQWRSEAEIPSQTEQSVALSKTLKKRGFSFVGPTIMYAYMQAVGMVNDHVVGCHRHQACAQNH